MVKIFCCEGFDNDPKIMDAIRNSEEVVKSTKKIYIDAVDNSVKHMCSNVACMVTDYLTPYSNLYVSKSSLDESISSIFSFLRILGLFLVFNFISLHPIQVCRL